MDTLYIKFGNLTLRNDKHITDLVILIHLRLIRVFISTMNNMPITVAVRYEARVCGLSTARIGVSNIADDTGTAFVFCYVSCR